MKNRGKYDPDALITGAELRAGFTYTNSVRYWANGLDYIAATNGELTHSQILQKGPRVFKSRSYARHNEASM